LLQRGQLRLLSARDVAIVARNAAQDPLRTIRVRRRAVMYEQSRNDRQRLTDHGLHARHEPLTGRTPDEGVEAIAEGRLTHLATNAMVDADTRAGSAKWVREF
jgi:hypothetical protein